jgi:hydroxymethylglutaryl-CoA lyase
MQIVEVGPRDGLQNEKEIISTADKVDYVNQLVAAGHTRIEAVSFARADRVPQMADAEAVMAGVPRSDTVSYSGLVMNGRGMTRALACGVDEVNIVIVASETFSMKNQNATIEQSLANLGPMVERARSADLGVTVTIGASFGCPFEGEVPTSRVASIVEKAAALGVSEIAMADTIGVGTPLDVRRLVKAAQDVTDLPLRLHLHNTRNTGYANAFAGAEMGVKALDSSSGGIGGCPFAPAATGNIATEDLAYMLERAGMPVHLDFDLLVEAAAFITAKLGMEPPALLGRAGWFPMSA